MNRSLLALCGCLLALLGLGTWFWLDSAREVAALARGADANAPVLETAALAPAAADAAADASTASAAGVETSAREAAATPAAANASPRTIEVHVVDERGEPVPLAQLEVQEGSQLPGAIVQSSIETSFGIVEVAQSGASSASCDERGVARIELPAPDPDALVLPRVQLVAVIDPPVGASVEARHLQGEPLVLVAPAMGSVEVRALDADGRIPPDGAQVWLGITREQLSGTAIWQSSHRIAERVQPLSNGVARFDFVALDVALDGALKRNAQASVHYPFGGAGPTRARPLVSFQLRLGTGRPVLAGRALDEAGRPLAGVALEALLRGSMGAGSEIDCGQLVPDARGEFRLDLMALPRSRGSVALVLRQRRRAPLAALEASAPLPGDARNGWLPLGDLVLREAPVLAEGLVLDELGKPVAGAHFELEGPVMFGDARTPSWWQGLPSTEGVLSDERGAFAIHGANSAAELHLRAVLAEARSPQISFAPGARGLALQLRRPGSVSGRVLLDPGVPAERLSVVLERVEAGDESISQSTAGPIDAQGAFEVRGLEAGPWTLKIGCEGENFFELPGLLVEGGAQLRDPRLDPVDLRGRLHALRIEAVDSAGAPLAQAELKWWASGKGQEWQDRHSASVSNGQLQIVVGALPVDLELGCEGYCAATAERISTDQRLVLQRATRLRIELIDVAQLPSPPNYIGPALALKHGDSVDVTPSSRYFDATGAVVSWVPRAGLYQLHWQIAHIEQSFGMSTTRAPEHPLEFEVREGGPEEQLLRVEFDPSWLSEQLKLFAR